MTHPRRWLPVLGALALLAAPAPVLADEAPPDPIRRAATAAAQAAAAAPAGGSKVKRNAVRGALIGAGVATAVVIASAVAYGANEGGGICAACALQWGAIGIGVGAASPSQHPDVGPMPAAPAVRSRRGVAFAVRF